MKFEWETIYSSIGNRNITTRAKVENGWIVKHRSAGDNPAITMVFIPDPKHKWSIEE